MLLAIDTATRFASLALHDGGGVRAEMTWELLDRHTVELMPRVEWMLTQLDARAGDVRALAVSIGPGSFTGLRAGLAVAKGLALANDAPIVGIRTHDVIVAAQPAHVGQLAAVVQAGRGRLALQRYRRVRREWRAHGDLVVTTADRIGADWDKPTWLCGEMDEAQRTRIAQRLGARVTLASPAHSLRRAGFLAELGWRRIREDDVDDLDKLVPIYLPTAGVASE